jgi:hypothetical protein
MKRCPTHGRVYDDAKERGCPLCLSGPPVGKLQSRTDPEEAAQKGRLVLLVSLLVLAAAGASAWYYFSTHNAETRAQAERDSLRAIAAGPPRPDTSVFAKADDLSPIRRARALHAGLSGLIRADRAAVLRYAEGPVDTTVADRTAKRTALAYVRLAERWRSRLDTLTRDGTDFRYEPGVQYSLQMEQVTNYLGAAVSVLRSVAPTNRVRSADDRRNDLTTAGGYLARAASELSNLPR